MISRNNAHFEEMRRIGTEFEEKRRAHEEKKQEILGSIREALSEIPEQFQADVGRSITHDIGVMAKTIGIVNANQPG